MGSGGERRAERHTESGPTDLVACGKPSAPEVDVEPQPLVRLRRAGAGAGARTRRPGARCGAGRERGRGCVHRCGCGCGCGCVRARGNGRSVEDLDRPPHVAAQVPGVDCVQAAEGRVQQVRPRGVEHQLTARGTFSACAYRGRGARGALGTHLRDARAHTITRAVFRSNKHDWSFPRCFRKQRDIRRRWCRGAK